jgi:modulator of FtsH protease
MLALRRRRRHTRGVNAYATQGWESFFVAEAGAAAALAGLLFVAVSINLDRILSIPGLSGRAAEALLILFCVIAVSSLGLVPGQALAGLGLEISGISALTYFYVLFAQFRVVRPPGTKLFWTGVRVVGSSLGLLPLVIGGVSTVLRAGGGLYWLGPGVILSFGAALLDAWVLLIEIQR